jgi:hypothetical protein
MAHSRWEVGAEAAQPGAPGLPGHDWARFLQAKRKELQRLNGAYKNTLAGAKVVLGAGMVAAHDIRMQFEARSH